MEGKKEISLGKYKIQARNMVLLPKVVRTYLGVEKGDAIEYIYKDGDVIIRGVKEKA